MQARALAAGGRAGNLDLADTWTYDGSIWSQVVGGELPAPRSEHAMEFDAATGAVYSFVGTTAAGVTPGLAVWNGTAWSDRFAIGPRQRTQHALAYDFGQRRIVMFGGRSQSDPTRDTWLLTSNPSGIAAPREGTGCGSGSGGNAAVLQPFGRPYAGNRRFAIDLFTPRRQLTAQPAVFLISAAEASVQFGACRLAIDPNALLAAVPAAESRGFATLPLPLPAAPALFGTTLFVQAVHRDPPTPLDGLALSLSLWLAIGDR